MKIFKSKKIALLLLCIQSLLMAHPHMFVDVAVKYNTNSTGVKNVEMVWVIDKMNSTQIIDVYDTDKNHKFEKSELVNMLSVFKSNLLKMVEISYGDTNIPLKDVVDFTAVATPQNNLLFSFTLPYEFKADKNAKELKTIVYDSEMFIAFTFQKDRVLALHKNTSLSNSIAFVNKYDKEILSVTVAKEI